VDQEATSENKEHVQYSVAGYSFGNPEKICKLSCLQKERSIAACSLQSEDEQLPERDFRPVSDKEEPDYPHSPSPVCHICLFSQWGKH
ncbi:hypothetical protein, partial [Bacteroides sp. OF04-15BH]|uniref:hypothetical protein n=1 Tax=Bacteroides sp. OF04-15BH TaxID=2292281 RepID=UPI00351A5279